MNRSFGGIGEPAAEYDGRGDDRKHENEEGHQFIGQVDISPEPVVVGRGAQERPDHTGYDDPGDGVEETFQTVVIVAVAVVGGIQGEEIAVGPEKTVRKPHDKPRHDDPGQVERFERHHHGHRNAAQQHPERIEVRNPDAAHEKAVHQEGERDARVDGQLVAHHIRQLRAVAHDVGADEKFHDGEDERIQHVRQQEYPHVERVGSEMPDFRESLAENAVARGRDGCFFHVSSLVLPYKNKPPGALQGILL